MLFLLHNLYGTYALNKQQFDKLQLRDIKVFCLPEFLLLHLFKTLPVDWYNILRTIIFKYIVTLKIDQFCRLFSYQG